MAQAGAGGAVDDALRGEIESASFLKKRSKKLFPTVGFGNAGATTRRSKSFLVLFFKKEHLACLLGASA
jgi:hypothetical protein